MADKDIEELWKEITKIKNDIKEVKRLQGVGDTFSTDINKLVSEFNEARKAEIAKLRADVAALTAGAAAKKK